MSDSLASFQSSVVKCLFDPDENSELTRQPGFAVYRNTVMSGCVDALQANFPSVVRLVGSGWFRATAATYVRARPPSDGRMLMYGASFADFLADFESARDFAYLPGVATLDWLWIGAHTAEDAVAVDSAWLATLAPYELGAVRLQPHPATRWRVFEDLPVYSIWARNRVECESADEIVWRGEGALLTRPTDAVMWQAIEPCGGAFLDACADGCGLAEAAGAALEVHPGADIAALLSQLLSAGALICPTSIEERLT
ncbi:DNA-binding domain-containing protein [Ramlibacter sp.]|uniref:HvfC/BufC N-terminal domain-containing protein n=1 Tax=Ramlibacter sp. TaxID=1917967 RepID=UPI0017ECCF7C|nr:DNA-binding domain-containing protein [Ramlibacter sp.]MBA2675937.1 putative DNA-binding domain-containing protein [Ramlibacter sp.]